MNDTEFSNELKTRLNRILPTKNYSRNPIFIVIRDLIRVKGYWKNKSRGNPSKGYKAMREKKNENNI